MCNMRTIGPAVSEKKIFEIVDDGRTPEHGYTISSPMSLRLSIKCVVDEGDIHYVRDVGILLQLLHIQHPVGQYLVRVVQSLVNQHHTGAALLLFWLRSFFRVAVSLIEQGLERKEVDRLMHLVFEECIQHTRTITIELDLLSNEFKAENQSLLGENLKENQRHLGSNKPKVEREQKSKKKKGKGKEENSKGSQSVCKDSRRQYNSDTKPKKHKNNQSSPLSNHAKLSVEYNLDNIEIELQDVTIGDDQAQKKPTFTPKEQSNCPRKGKQKSIMNAETDLQTERTRNQEAKDVRDEGIPVIHLEMKNMGNNSEQDINDETDWFFNTTEIVGSGKEMHKHEHPSDESKSQDRLNMENLRQKWDSELLDDIKDLKEGIESDLKIVNERRKRLNEKLAKYIKIESSVANDDEFDDCFEGLERDGAVDLKKSKQENETYLQSKSQVAANFTNASHVQNDIQNASQKSNAAPRNSKNVEEIKPEINFPGIRNKDSEHSLISKSGTTDRIGTENIKGNTQFDRRHLNVVECGMSKGVGSCGIESNVKEKVDAKDKFLCKTSNLTPVQAENVVCHESKSSDSKERTPHGKTSLHKIDSLLMGLGVTDKKIGTQLEINKTSRYLNDAEADKEDLDVSFTMKVNVCTSIACSEPRNTDNLKKVALNEDRITIADNDKAQTSVIEKHDETRVDGWLIELIRGLCPEAEPGVAEVVQQVVNKQHGTSGNPGHYKRERYSDLSNVLIQCYSLTGVLPRQPELVDGVIIATSTDIMQCIQQFGGCSYRMVLVNGDLQPNYHHKGYKKVPNSTAVGGMELMSGHVTQTDQWLIDVRAVLKEFSVNLILVRGPVCEQMKLLCQQEGIVAMETVPYKTMEILAETCKADMVTYITLVSENNIGENITLSPWKPDWMDQSEASQQEVILRVPGQQLQTVVFQELTNQLASLKEQEFWECFHLVTSSLKSGQVLPGAGQTETSCMEFCWRRAAELRSRRKQSQAETYLSVVFDELASAFKEFTDLYTANAGAVNMGENNKLPDFMARTKCDSGVDSLLSQETSIQSNNLCINHSLQASQNSDDQIFVNQSMKAVSDPDDKSESHDDNKSTFSDKSPTQAHGFDNCSYYIDDCATKLAAWRKALDTVFVILGIDSFIQTGLTDESTDRKLCHSAL